MTSPRSPTTAGRNPRVVSRPTGPGQGDQDAERRDENAAERDLEGEQRGVDGDRRDLAAERRDTDAERRDVDAGGRDLAGVHRDADAEGRDQREREAELRDGAGASATTGIGVAVDALAGLRRERAASDRRGATRDRAEAAAERGQAGLDRGTALADRAAGASDRGSAGSDRGEAADDRAASATDRQFAAAATQVGLRELAATVDAGFALRQIDPPQYLYLNPAFFTVFGFDPSGPTPTPADWMSLIHPDDRALVGSIPAAVTAGETIEQQWRVTRGDGVQRWISGRVSAVTDDDGVIRRVAVIFEDITNRKAAAAALRESQARFDQFARSTEVGFLLRESTRVLYMNSGMFRIFGVDPELPDLSVSDMRSMVHPEDRDAVAAWTAAADRGEATRTELRIIRADGEVRWIRATNDPVNTTDGGLPRVASTVTDITDHRALEAAVRAARVEAERANAAKDEFLSRMSHELRTPLNAVLGFAQLLELDAQSPSQAQAVGHILRGGQHLLAMINDLLDIAGIESDRLQLSPEPVHIADLISDTIGLLQPLAATNRIEILFDPGHHPDAARYVRADRRRLRQVLLNLLSNAIKYNHPDGRVDIRVEPADDDTHLGVAVTDTGIGIPAQDLPRLFQPFDRLGRESSAIEGTGLGLALSERLTTLMGGRVDVESTPGHGSTFTVTMPLTDPPEEPPPPRDLTGEIPAADVALSTVLSIQDNPSNVALLTGILRRRPGWSLIHAGTGRLGLDLAATSEPTVILLDLHLPDIDGIDVLQALRADPNTSDVPVAVFSADADPTQVRRLLAAGAQKYLTKPLAVRDVFAFLDAHTR